MSILRGAILSVVADKGFGFIQPRDGGPDVFFHRSAVNATLDVLESGQEVEYELDSSSARPRAATVRIANAGGARRTFFDRPARRTHHAHANSDTRTIAGQEFGFITKLWRHDLRGFISSVKHGPELMFEAASVIGDKRFSDLKVGEYVRFLRGTVPDDSPQPIARSVMVVEREIRSPRLNLPKHQRARGKKPSWR